MEQVTGSKLGFDTTGLSDTTHTGYIKSGVVDNSKAIDTATDFNFATGIADTALKGAMEIKKQSVLGDIQEQVEGLSTEIGNRSLEGQASLAEGIMANQAEIGDAKTSAGYDGTYPTALNSELHEDIVGIQGELQGKIDTLTRAKQQGVMSDFELSQRLAKLTKEAVTANPYYTNEIIAQASQTASLNNLTARVKNDNSIIEAQGKVEAAAEKKLVETALKFNVDIYNPDGSYQNEDGSLNVEAVALETSVRQQKKSMYEKYKVANDTNQQIRDLNADQLLDTDMPTKLSDAVVYGSDARFNQVLLGEGTPAEKSIIMERVAQEELSGLKAFYTKQGVALTDPRAKAAIEDAESRLEAVKGLYIDSVTGKTNADAMKNQLNYLVDSEAHHLYKANPGLSTDLIVLDAIKGFSPLMSGTAKLKMQQKILETLSTTPMGNSDTKNRKVNDPYKKLNEKGIKLSPISSAVIGASGTLVANSDDATLETWTDLLESRVAYQQNEGQYVDKQVQEQEYQNFVKDLNNPKVVKAMNQVDNPQLKQSISDNVEAYVPVLKNSYDRFKELSPNKKLAVLGDSLVVKDASLKETSFIKNDLKTINENAKAWSMLTGNPVTDYFDMVMGKTKEA